MPLSGPVAGGSFKNGLDGITKGADGKLAFTESAQGAIGKIATTGSYNAYPIGSLGSLTGQGPDQITTASGRRPATVLPGRAESWLRTSPLAGKGEGGGQKPAWEEPAVRLGRQTNRVNDNKRLDD